jgi:hypothetical protein
MVPASWLNSWDAFVSATTIYDLPPSAIDNSRLQEDYRKGRKLQEGTHFDAYPENVWQFWVHSYGGGPALSFGATRQEVVAREAVAKSTASSSDADVVLHATPGGGKTEDGSDSGSDTSQGDKTKPLALASR